MRLILSLQTSAAVVENRLDAARQLLQLTHQNDHSQGDGDPSVSS